MIEKTVLALPGRKVSVPRVFKRSLQVAVATVLTAVAVLVLVVGNGLFVGKTLSLQAGWVAWLGFIKRPDILATMALTAAITVMFVYWQRDREQK